MRFRSISLNPIRDPSVLFDSDSVTTKPWEILFLNMSRNGYLMSVTFRPNIPVEFMR